MRVVVLGATGTIGQATVRALLRAGHEVTCLLRPRAGVGGRLAQADMQRLLTGTTLRFGDPTDGAWLRREGLATTPAGGFDALVSCLASRSGAPADAWAIDHRAHATARAAAQDAGIGRMVLLSAICVQKPLLAFQQAKLAFERELMASGLAWSIVRPTAFFKSLSGQVARVQRGQPFLLFGDGTLTACKPIHDNDLGDFIAGCLTDPARQDRILPIGGPGAALTPRDQGDLLFRLAGRPPRFKQVPVALLDAVIAVLGTAGRLLPPLAAKAELARIGRYYATESMLVWDAAAGRYDAAATPSFGTRTLADHYADLLAGRTTTERGDHAVF